MRRREFILGGVAASWTTTVRAQQHAAPLIGYMDTASASTTAHLVEAFRRGLSAAGFDEDRNVSIEYRWAEGDYNKLPALAVELVRRQVVVIATVNTPTILAAKAATDKIPIVFGVGIDPIKFGLVASLNRPGGNLTGVTQLNIDLEGKHVQLLHELVPGPRPMALLINRTSIAFSEATMESAQSAARILGVRLLLLNASNEGEIDAAFATLAAERAASLLVSADSFLVSKRDQLVALAARYAVPALYPRREFTDIGGLMSYGPSLPEVYYQVGDYTGRILKGAKPADLPVQQSTKFELVINAKTAKALGIEVPISMQMLASEVID